MLRRIKAAYHRARRTSGKRNPGWYPDFEPIARVEPPVEFTSPPPMPEAELEALQRRAHP